MPTEKDLQGFLLKKARAAGMLAYKVESIGQRGFPDCVLISQDGRVVFVEVKHPNGRGRLSIHQLEIIEKLEQYGANIYVIDSKAKALDIVEQYA